MGFNRRNSFSWNTNEQSDEAWKCPTCGLMITYGHICKVRETVQCVDCHAMLEKGLEDRHYKNCPVRRERQKAERKQRATERREERKAKGVVGYIRRLPEKEHMIFMEPDEHGYWEEVEVEKYPWKCKICGLVWQTREDAERCPYLTDNPFCASKSPHYPMYQRMYGIRYVENGVPRGNPYTIDFKAMRKEEPEKLPEGKTWDIPKLPENPYGHASIRVEKRKAEEPQTDENPDPDVSELPDKEDDDPNDTWAGTEREF